MYNQKQVAEMLGIPARTLRRYSTDFEQHLSKQAKTGGKQRKYSEGDLLTLGRIRQLKQQRLGNEEINKRLKTTIQPTQPEGFSLGMIPAFKETLDGIESQGRTRDTRLDRIEGRDERAWRKYDRLNPILKKIVDLLGLAPENPYEF